MCKLHFYAILTLEKRQTNGEEKENWTFPYDDDAIPTSLNIRITLRALEMLAL